MEDSRTIRIPAMQMEEEFIRILLKQGFREDKARSCASVFTGNSVDGVLSHGVNRFSRFVKYVSNGLIDVDAEPELVHSAGAVEQWNGKLGPGPLNAFKCTERAMELARNSGIGCVALSNTNHWMRGGTYGWKAAKAGFVFIGWTNTIGLMPAWGAIDNKLGNNPLVIAVPCGDEAIVLDMARSQYSYGKMEMKVLEISMLDFPGGYNSSNELTCNPSEILDSKRPLPIGFWKGSGLTLLLDILAAILSGGLSTSEISKKKDESAVSQVFIAFDLSKLGSFPSIQNTISEIIADYKASVPVDKKSNIRYPGEQILKIRAAN
ncbi:MAG TPA: 3-dehydro-L-gulonate 2-dehydrogenase, partial [Prolixibacteraceae bacterium]